MASVSQLCSDTFPVIAFTQREREVNSSQRGVRDNRELELTMHESTSQLIAKDWKNGVKSKGNRIFFELAGGRVNRVHFSGVVL